MQREQVVFSPNQANAVLSKLDSPYWLVAILMNGSGLSLSECLQLRVKDIDFDINAILIRDSDGGNDRAVALSREAAQPLVKQMGLARCLHDQDLADGYGHTVLPLSMARKYGHRNGLASSEFQWQFVFPKSSLSISPRSGVVSRYHLSNQSVQSAVQSAIINANSAGANISDQASCHTFRHSFIYNQLHAQSTDASIAQKQPSYSSVNTTCTHPQAIERGDLTAN